MSLKPRLLLHVSVCTLLGLLAVASTAGAEVQANTALPKLAVTSAQIVSERTALSSLVVTADGALKAPEGKSLTLTVNGIGTGIAPGTYTGEVVLTPTENIVVSPMLGGTPYSLRAGLYIDGGFVHSKSVPSVLGNANITDTGASNLKLTSNDPTFTGVIITGKSTYQLKDPVIALSGNGGDDSIGYGAAIAIGGDAHVVLDRPRITTHGVIRTAIFVDGNADVTVNNAEIETFGGTLPPDYKFSILPGEMMEVPYGLGLSGNTRSTNVQGKAVVRYNNSHIKSHGWGVLATDGEGPTQLIVKNSRIETVDSGYGAYANGLAHDVFDHVSFNVNDYGVVIGGPGSATFTNRTVVQSGKIGVMMHQGTGGGTLTIEGGSVFKTKSTSIEVKGRGTTIIVDNARLLPGNGVLLQTMENDDPIMKDMMRAGPPPGASPPPGQQGPVYSKDVVATFRNTTLNGDIAHAMPGQSLTLTLQNTRLSGVISTALAQPASGQAPDRATYREVGNVINTFEKSADKRPLAVAIDARSVWTVPSTSYLTQLDIQAGGQIKAAGGRHIQLSVNGTATPIAPGHYEGDIVLNVTEN
ncbi:MAG: hypothetical protein QM647_17865 [Asticcacaulis sp.]|uniref:hypothetical protein n=1 Tax=Asticcacaulis sp. TaxID=1872648 RepID=UPI0039E465C6